ncbi:MAG: hypothetical protein RRB13_00300 [bacterium]|nr:hypothetical protein [bacterium]
MKVLWASLLAAMIAAPVMAQVQASGRLLQQKTYNFATETDPAAGGKVGQQDTGNFIEDKLFKIVADTYARRDEHAFLKLYEFFLKSFPNSQRRAELDQYRDKFFYSENLNIYKLGGALVDLQAPESKNWDQLSDLFRQLRQKGMKLVQVEVAQEAGEQIFLFAKGGDKRGYFFKNDNGPLLDDILDRMSELAHENDMKLLASLPLRDLPSLDRQPVMLMDSSYNPINHDLRLNNKLDLTHPAALPYLLNFTEALAKTKVDGIIIKDDFTYAPQEGFSEMSIRRFKLDTGISLDLQNLVVSYPANGDFGLVGKEEYQVFLEWRARQIRQLLWDFVEASREFRAEFTIGIELTPEMLDSNEQSAFMRYGTSVRMLWDLPVDFQVLKWSYQDGNNESDPEVYFGALSRLQELMDADRKVYLKVPLNDQTRNVIMLNQRIRRHLVWMSEHEGLEQAIGPIDRRKDWDFLHHRVVEKLEVPGQ